MPASDLDAVTSPRSAGPRPVITPALVAPLAVVAVLAALTAAALGLLLAGGEVATGVDRAVQDVVRGFWPEPGEGAYYIDFLGDPRMIAAGVAVVAVCCLVAGRRRCAVVVVLAPVVTGVVTTAAKPLVARTIHGPENLAFPSGHTAALASLAAVVLLFLIGVGQRGRLAGTVAYLTGTVLVGGFMAVDQIAIEAHYPTDTLGGLCVAIAIAPAVAVAVDRGADVLRRRRPAE